MSWYEGVEGTSKNLHTLSRQEQGGRSKKWKEEEGEEAKTRIELHPALHTCMCVCLCKLTYAISQSKHSERSLTQAAA